MAFEADWGASTVLEALRVAKTAGFLGGIDRFLWSSWWRAQKVPPNHPCEFPPRCWRVRQGAPPNVETQSERDGPNS
jgi:hypothetical protein